jgi:ribulose-5-phosphate 4-epimerase/fuculose-1-phosphate aldolase
MLVALRDEECVVNIVEHPSLESSVSAAEWQCRLDLAAAYRLVAHFGWDDLVFTHISARIPGEDGQFLINPYGWLFEEITASSLLKVNLAGEKLSASTADINPAGFVIHSAIHSGRTDAHCVMHTHSLNGLAVSAQKQGLLPITQQSLFVLASLGYHDYEGVALRDDEKPRLVADLGQKTFLILRNHGLLTVGPSPAAAFLAMYTLEAACTAQVRAQAGGAELLPIDKRILNAIQEQLRDVTRGLGADLVWPGLLRMLDRRDPGYRR